jgi:hypothetical protein
VLFVFSGYGRKSKPPALRVVVGFCSNPRAVSAGILKTQGAQNMGSKVKGRATIRSAAVLFLVSAVLEIFDYDSAAALFGGVYSGAVVVVYHAVFAGLYFLCGVGLWAGKKWGYWSVMATTAGYTVDKVQLILFPHAFYDFITQQLTVTRDIVGLVPKENFIQIFTIVYIVLVLCWWGFAAYIHMRRRYFDLHSPP